MNQPGQPGEPMTTLDVIRAALAGALRAPWVYEAVGEHGYPQRIMANDDGYTLVCELYWGDVDNPDPTAELIQHAPQWLAALVDVAEAAQAYVEWGGHTSTHPKRVATCRGCAIGMALAALDPVESS